MNMKKKCPHCKKIKDESEFYQSYKVKGETHFYLGEDDKPFVMYYCNVCRPEMNKKFYERYARRKKDATLKKKYGINFDHYKKLYQQNKGACAICGAKPKNCLVVDKLGDTVRGLLCTKCITFVHHLDNHGYLKLVSKYLNKPIG
jgi:Recombination endonuclease VII